LLIRRDTTYRSIVSLMTEIREHQMTHPSLS
jgi:hypothetical protein